jgi:regulator of sirC expression with transglutaminase-like and TPR domain
VGKKEGIVLRWLPGLLFTALAHGSPLTSLYSTLDPGSVAQHFAFYELYPETPEGRAALKHAWKLLSGGCVECDPEVVFPSIDATAVIALVNRAQEKEAPVLGEQELQMIEKLARHLPNRKLKGFGVWSKKEVLGLPPEEIDLARGLLIADIGSADQRKVRSYEATLDLMALQILARLKPDASPLEKVRAINDYVFSELRFRFPPHSLSIKNIDEYTLLPSVLDSRRGVCLGVSILYLALAQRLDLPLEAITPPGHIYVRYRAPNGDITNIETTARGIDIPSDRYLSLEARKLQQRNIKEVIGLAFMNQASVAWHRENPQMAIALYEKGREFLPDDPLIKTFLGLQYLFVGEKAKGESLLKAVRGHIADHQVVADSIVEDYLAGQTDAAAIQSVFREVDETRQSILAKQKEIEGVIQKFPRFRSALFHLAITYLQLGREKEAIPILERYMEIDTKNPTVCYYLAALHAQRLNYNAAWKYLRAAETLVRARNHAPKVLEDLRMNLQRSCPEPS